MGVTVEYLKNINFAQLPLNEKLHIKSKGRSTPDILIQQPGVSKNKTYIRGFNIKWYERMKWLCGCEIKNALFCFPCLLFGGDPLWTKTGFTNVAGIKVNCEKHQTSRKHMENVVSLSLLSPVDISSHMNELSMADKSKHNEHVKKNREVLSKMIDCLKLYGDFELLLCAQRSSDLAEITEVLKALFNFLVSMDPSLQNHLEQNSVFHGTFSFIQNELLQNIVEVFRDEIASEINKASYLAVIAEDTTDVSEDVQLAIIFRYELQGVIHERLWGCFKPESRSPEAVAKCLINEIKKVVKHDKDKLIGHTYYETGIVNGEYSVQQQVQQVFHNANFIHCYAHQPNNIIKHVCSSLHSTRLFFASLLEISSFFSKYPEKLVILYKHAQPHISKARNAWDFDTKTVNTVFENKQNLILCFEELQSTETTDKIIEASTKILAVLRNKTFLSLLELFHTVMPHVEELYDTMQSRNIDSFKIQKSIIKFDDAIYEIRNSNLCETPESKEICDRIGEEARQRFSFTNHLIAAKLFYYENFEYYSEEFPTFEIKETCLNFTDLVKDKLMTELKIFYSRQELHSFNGLLALLSFFAEEDLPTVFTETIKLIKILVTIPMTTDEPERCFSSVKRIRTFLSNCTAREELTALAMIFIEKQKISQIKNFNEKVIERFCSRQPRRMDFTYK